MKVNWFLSLLLVLFILNAYICVGSGVDSSSSDVSSSDSSSDDSTTTSGPFAHLFSRREYKKMKRKRIRRNVYDLSESEWNDIADAMNIMKQVPEKDGRKLFGKYYRSYDSLVCQHARGAMHPLGDMGHFQAHFLLWHRAFVLAFENSLISINKRIKGVPYWNYFDDVSTYGNDLTNATIFSDKYLGQFSGDDLYNGAVTNGKFAFWPIAKFEEADDVGCPSIYQNAYGFLRQRNNPSDNPFVTRYGGSVCGNEYPRYSILLFLYNVCKNEKNNTIQEFFNCMNFPVHATSHIVVGGTRQKFDGQVVDPNGCVTLHVQGTREINNIEKYALNYGCFNCPPAGSCEVGVDDLVTCAQCTLANENGTCNIEGIDFQLTGELDETNQHLRADFSDYSTSPNDPIFMFHHVNMDKYLSEWQLLNYENNINGDPYYGYQTSGYETGINLDDVLADEFPFENLFKSRRIGRGPYTNRDILDGTQFLKSPYTYDTILELIQQ